MAWAEIVRDCTAACLSSLQYGLNLLPPSLCPMPSPLLEVSNLHVTFGAAAPLVRGVSLALEAGEKLALVGVRQDAHRFGSAAAAAWRAR